MFKKDLIFRTSWMNAAGFLGFAPEPRAVVNWDQFGAFVTNPISLRPRLPAARPELLSFQGGFLLHNGLPNPGFSGVLKGYSRIWADAIMPIIPHIMADRPDETVQMVRSLEGLENIAAIELGFAPQLSDDILLLVVQMCLGELPLIVNLPFEQVLTLGPKLIQIGAAVLSLSAPRGALPVNGGTLVSGRLYGPAIFPQSLALVRDVARLGLPIIGGAGLYSKENALSMLDAGAMAVQLDAVLWKNSGWLG